MLYLKEVLLVELKEADLTVLLLASEAFSPSDELELLESSLQQITHIKHVCKLSYSS
jgi:hypothetical protein